MTPDRSQIIEESWEKDYEEVLDLHKRHGITDDELYFFLKDLPEQIIAARDRFWLEKIVPKEMVFNYRRPGKDPKTGKKRGYHQCQGWNACLDEFKSNYARMKGEK